MMELVVVIGIIALLLTIGTSAIQSARESVRQTACLSNQRQIGIALMSYSATYGVLPPSVNIEVNPPLGLSSLNPYGIHTRILPYLDELPTYNLVQFATIPKWDDPILNLPTPSIFVCPSESARTRRSFNYCFSIGVRSQPESRWPPGPGEYAGAFETNPQILGVGTGGMSNLILGSERSCGSKSSEKSIIQGTERVPFRQGNGKRDWFYLPSGRGIPRGGITPNQWTQVCAQLISNEPDWETATGGLWYAGEDGYFNHILTPNSRVPDCGIAVYPMIGVRTARSEHSGLVLALFADGRVQKISESLDLNVWRVWGSRHP